MCWQGRSLRYIVVWNYKLVSVTLAVTTLFASSLLVNYVISHAAIYVSTVATRIQPLRITI